MIWPRRVGDYIIGWVLGHGGFGEVRIGENIYTRETFAAKVLPFDVLETDEQNMDARREMSILMAMQHPFIVTLYDVLYHKKKLFLIMELAENDLCRYLQSQGPIPEVQARNYFRQLVDAILYCHAHGIYHRDIKPENLLLTKGLSTLKLADFGFAAVVDKCPMVPPSMKTVCGSRHFCAPEVFRTNGYEGSLTDAYSCGAVLRSMLVGMQHTSAPSDSVTVAEEPMETFPEGFSKWKDFPGYISESAVDLVCRLMQPHPENRLSLDEAKQHPWMTVNTADQSISTSQKNGLNRLEWFHFMLQMQGRCECCRRFALRLSQRDVFGLYHEGNLTEDLSSLH